MAKKSVWVGAGILILVILVIAVPTILMRATPPLHGSVIDPPAPAADFSLTDQSGRTVRLSEFRGRYVLMFFGFTHCTEECPATMAILEQVVAALGDEAGKVRVLFVSTDPERDTPQAVGEFVARFDPAFVGLTGSQADLQPVWRDYGVTVLDGGETHSTFVYLIDPAGDIRLTYAFPMAPEDLTADLQLLMKRQ